MSLPKTGSQWVLAAVVGGLGVIAMVIGAYIGRMGHEVWGWAYGIVGFLLVHKACSQPYSRT